VLQKSLAGPLNNFAKFSTLQDYGVDKVFWLETGNVDSSQKNVVFLSRGTAKNALAIAGMSPFLHFPHLILAFGPLLQLGRSLRPGWI
jgi:hypothetical protein